MCSDCEMKARAGIHGSAELTQVQPPPYESQSTLDLTATLIGAWLASDRDHKDVDQSICDHVITVAVNCNLRICVLCRKQICGETAFGLAITAPHTPTKNDA